MEQSIKVIWDNIAKEDLKLIFDFIKVKSPQGAKNVVGDILNQIKNIRFVEQYQADEILGEPYRRIIVRDYKVVYKVQNEAEIKILQIFDTRQSFFK